MHAASVCPEPGSNSPTKNQTTLSGGLFKLRVRSKNQRDRAWRSCHSSAVKDRAPTSHVESAYGRDADAHHTYRAGRQSTKTGPSGTDEVARVSWATPAGQTGRSQGSPTPQRSADRHLVRLLEVSTHRKTARETSY